MQLFPCSCDVQAPHKSSFALLAFAPSPGIPAKVQAAVTETGASCAQTRYVKRNTPSVFCAVTQPKQLLCSNMHALQSHTKRAARVLPAEICCMSYMHSTCPQCTVTSKNCHKHPVMLAREQTDLAQRIHGDPQSMASDTDNTGRRQIL